MSGYQRNYRWVLFLLTLSVSSSETDFSNADSEDVSNKGCNPGYVPNADDTCQECYKGFYADLSVQRCLPCPLNTYSENAANVNCTACPHNKKTINKASSSVDQCVDVCEIPATMNAYYERASTNEFLGANERVAAGEQIILQCRDRDYKVAKTEFSRLTVRCTATFKNIDLPNTCVSDGETGDKISRSGMICYDSCYRETSDDQTRYVKLVGGGTVIVDSCPLVECEGDEDMCVSVSYTDTFKNLERVHFSCQQSSKFDTEICRTSGASAEEIEKKRCKVRRCKTERCNDPETVKTTSSSTKLSAASVLTMFYTLITILWR